MGLFLDPFLFEVLQSHVLKGKKSDGQSGMVVAMNFLKMWNIPRKIKLCYVTLIADGIGIDRSLLLGDLKDIIEDVAHGNTIEVVLIFFG